MKCFGTERFHNTYFRCMSPMTSDVSVIFTKLPRRTVCREADDKYHVIRLCFLAIR